MGNSIDNIENPKLLSIFSLLSLSIIWFLTAAWVDDALNEATGLPPSVIIVYLANAAQVVSTGVILVSIMQIYNWFSHKSICTMMSIFFGAEFVGYLTPIPYVTVATQMKSYTTA